MLIVYIIDGELHTWALCKEIIRHGITLRKQDDVFQYYVQRDHKIIDVLVYYHYVVWLTVRGFLYYAKIDHEGHAIDDYGIDIYIDSLVPTADFATVKLISSDITTISRHQYAEIVICADLQGDISEIDLVNAKKHFPSSDITEHIVSASGSLWLGTSGTLYNQGRKQPLLVDVRDVKSDRREVVLHYDNTISVGNLWYDNRQILCSHGDHRVLRIANLHQQVFILTEDGILHRYNQDNEHSILAENIRDFRCDENNIVIVSEDNILSYYTVLSPDCIVDGNHVPVITTGRIEVTLHTNRYRNTKSASQSNVEE